MAARQAKLVDPFAGADFSRILDPRIEVKTTPSGARVLTVKPGSPAYPPAGTGAASGAGSASASGSAKGGGGAKGGKGGNGGKGGKAKGGAAKAGKASTGTEGVKSFARRDKLVSIAKKWQKRWDESKIFEVDAPTKEEAAAAASAASAGRDAAADSTALGAGVRGKFLVTFPYPYMNGRLHLGHAFSLTKAEFAARFNRLIGNRTLFPFAFHCTGMPIQAAANRLKRELFGDDDPEAVAAATAAASAAAAADDGASATPALKAFKSKKTKTAAKAGKAVSQADILRMVGVTDEEMEDFVKPEHWLQYFPPYGRTDLEEMGLAVDWRRSFITTDANPHYDSFVRWQFNRLKKQGKVKFGQRPTIYSPRDGQACADHDRASGEGVAPQEYTLIKLRMLAEEDGSYRAPHMAELTRNPETGAERAVYLVAATLRPETMYGQTNCFVLPDGDYGAYEMSNGEVFVCSHRSALNMSYQALTATEGKPKQLASFAGTDLIGCPLNAPNSVYDRVYCLPLFTISMGKGTGIVTSVPSDAPDDYAALNDIKNKEPLRAKFGIEMHMVEPFKVVEIIEIPGMGSAVAASMCESMGVKSQNDKVKIAEIKEKTYMDGFYKGIMLMGDQAGTKVSDAKPIIRAQMIAAGTAAAYYEPEKLVMSRSGDECVVSYLDQWYLEYGEEMWKTAVTNWVNGGVFTSYNKLAHDQYNHVLGWLQEWACSRNFGLGTRVPWDEQFVIESLSDSTVYMSYYTVAHMLQGRDNLDGTKPGPSGVKPGAMDDAAWDYVLLGAAYPSDGSCAVPEAVLGPMRNEFEFWYPLDLRVSGKDLIGNHLTMSLYNHAAIFEGREDRMPQSFFTNGHVGVNGEKMSKSLGNFLTLTQSIERFRPDAMRFALADAGDGMEDANFDTTTADAALSRLFVEEATYRLWMAVLKEDKAAVEAVHKEIGSSTVIPTFRGGEADTFMDRLFDARISHCVMEAHAGYSSMRFRDALKFAFYELQAARDNYRDSVEKAGSTMHAGLIRHFLHAQAVVMAPICPHWAEEVWETIGRPGGEESVHSASWPAVKEPDTATLESGMWLLGLAHSIRSSVDGEMRKINKKAKKGEEVSFDACVVYTKDDFLPWQVLVLDTLRGMRNADGGYPKTAMKELQTAIAASTDPDVSSRKPKDIMAFGAACMKDTSSKLLSSPSFRDREEIERNMDFLISATGLKQITIVDADEAEPSHASKVTKVVPGSPVVLGSKSVSA
jgi:leucyl-tRNA synthetase